jgi:hypothetical protein
MAAKRETTSGFWLRRGVLAAIVIASLALIVAVQVWEIRFSPRSSTTATVVELVGPDSTAQLLGIEVRAIGNFLPADVTEQDRERIAFQCGSDFDGLVESPPAGMSILRNPIVVLHIAETGDICLEEGESRDFGKIDVTVRSVGRVTANGELVNEVALRESEPWLFIAVTMTTFVLTLFVGAALGVLLDVSYRQSELADLDADVRQAMRASMKDEDPPPP